jgi:hypothetical protein
MTYCQDKESKDSFIESFKNLSCFKMLANSFGGEAAEW